MKLQVNSIMMSQVIQILKTFDQGIENNNPPNIKIYREKPKNSLAFSLVIRNKSIRSNILEKKSSEKIPKIKRKYHKINQICNSTEMSHQKLNLKPKFKNILGSSKKICEIGKSKFKERSESQQILKSNDNPKQKTVKLSSSMVKR